MNFSLEVAKSFVGTVVQAVLGFAGTTVFARVLGPVEFGGFYLLLSISQIIDRPFKGWSMAVKKRFSEYESNRSEIFGSQVFINIIGLVVIGFGAILLESYLISYTGLDHALLVLLVILATIAFFEPLQQMLDASGRPALSTWIDTVRSILTTPFQVGLVLLGFGAVGMGFGLAGATTITVLVSYRNLDLRPTLPSRETLESVWEFARYSLIYGIVGKAYERYDVLLLGALLGQTSVANYEVALKLTLPAIFISNAITGALVPRISNLNSRGESVGADATNSLAFASLSAIPIFFGAVAIPQTLVVTVFGSPYRDAAVLLVGLALVRIIQIQANHLSNVLQGVDRPDVPLRITSIAFALNIVVGYVLVIQIGTLGAVIGTVIAGGLRYAILAYRTRTLIDGVRLLPRPLIEQIVAGFVMFLAVEGLHSLLSIQSWVELLLLVGTGAAVYGLMLLAISTQLRYIIREVVKDVLTATRHSL
jgi:O-antigen/teichoic acid export membrane protein